MKPCLCTGLNIVSIAAADLTVPSCSEVLSLFEEVEGQGSKAKEDRQKYPRVILHSRVVREVSVPIEERMGRGRVC